MWHHQIWDTHNSPDLLYSRKLSREKTSTNFTLLWLFVKVFSAKFGGVAPTGIAKVSNCESFLHKSFLCEKLQFSPIHESFLPQKFLTYGMSQLANIIMHITTLFSSSSDNGANIMLLDSSLQRANLYAYNAVAIP